jgi:hypothetical protein
MSAQRTYKVGREGTLIGTFDEPEMVYLIGCGKVLQSDDYWTEGMFAWEKISSKSHWKIAHSISIPAVPPAGKQERSKAGPVSDDDRRREFLQGTSIQYPDPEVRGMPMWRPGKSYDEFLRGIAPSDESYSGEK